MPNFCIHDPAGIGPEPCRECQVAESFRQVVAQNKEILARIVRLEWVAEAQGFCIKPSDV